jgi:hypothetical protein
MVVIITTFIFLYFYFNSNFNLQQEISPYVLPKIIWVFWDKPELPELIKTIKENNDMKLRGWEIIYLNELNIDNYISKDEYPDNFNTLGIQHKTDWIRLYLLNKYGGTWLDASIIINDVNALVKLYNDSINIQSQFTGFNFKNYEDGAFSNNGIPLYVENWFIMAPINSKVINLWLIQYERAIEMGFQNYRKVLDNENIDTSKIFGSSSGVYLTQHVAFQVIMRNMLLRPFIILYRAEDTMLRLKDKCNWSSICIMETIRDDPTVKTTIPFIKLTSGETHLDIDISGYFK